MASLSIRAMKSFLLKETKYSGSKSWTDRVNSMSDSQIMAVYFRCQKKREEVKDGEQLSIYSMYGVQ